MSKRHGSSVESLPHTTLKRHRSSVVESLPHDVVELILEKLPVKFLLRFRAVSKMWKSTVDSKCFQERQLIRRRQSRDRDVLVVTVKCSEGSQTGRIMLGSSVVCTVRFPTSCLSVCHGSCDGLVCLYCIHTPSVVINPATRWSQSFPLSNIQQVISNSIKTQEYGIKKQKLGFGKDKFTGTLKPVCLYNSSELGLDNVTTCEVYDFRTNAWRYVLPASPCRILAFQDPVYLDGSLYWLTDCEETKVLSLDLHTETFEVICEAPFAHVREDDPRSVSLCVLEDRLCVTEKIWPTQVIWSVGSSGGDKTWKKICTIDLTITFPWFGEYQWGRRPISALLPVAILEKNKLLLHGRDYLQPLVMHDLHTKSYDLVLKPNTTGVCVSYFQSLFSATTN